MVCAKTALLNISKKILLSKLIQNLTDMIYVLFKRLAINQDVIKVNNNKFANECSQDMVH